MPSVNQNYSRCGLSWLTRQGGSPHCAAGITAHRALLVAATDDVDAFFAAVVRFGVTVPSRRRDDLLPAGVVQAVFEPIVGTARERAGRCSPDAVMAVTVRSVVDGGLVVPWADLEELGMIGLEWAGIGATSCVIP
ncbi:hypothetical protein L1080_032445 [Rhodococcus sp. MSC1_016]|jgi:hypothetical protein|uniref:hypothetical protein n=1 Tax=Rhodococcus sp. MSC1_016 TaxID=2909266 RepID=UPI00202F2217|nr:hypothetical protein [Rhodococcus sp. MSC1_016]